MKELFFLIEESLDGGYEARALNESIFTEADDLTQLKKNIIDAVKCHYDKEEYPRIIRLHFVKEEVLTI